MQMTYTVTVTVKVLAASQSSALAEVERRLIVRHDSAAICLVNAAVKRVKR